MVKLDLKDAYLQVPIHPDHQKYLTFQWNSKFYQFTCLPFGLSTAPRAFTKFLKPVVEFLRQIGCRLIVYLDDILILHQDSGHLQQITQSACQLFECLDLLVNSKKSSLTPCQKLEFLGFQLCAQTLRLSVPLKKMRKIQQDTTQILAQEQIQLREVDRFVGKVVAVARAFPIALLHYKALQFTMNSVLPVTHSQEDLVRKYNSMIKMNTESKADLVWWKSLDRTTVGTPILQSNPSEVIESDALTKVGGSAEWTDPNWGSVVSQGNSLPHQLPITAGSLSSNKSIWQRMEGYYSPDPDGQFHCGDLYQSERGHLFHTVVPIAAFQEDTTICSVTALKAYEVRTDQFRHSSSGEFKSKLSSPGLGSTIL